METIKKVGYIIHKTTDDNYCLCRIIKEYGNVEDAKNDLIDLLSRNTPEKKIIKK